MRKWVAMVMVLALALCGLARAASVTDALGITGGGDSSVRGDLSARTTTDLFVVMNDGSDKALVRIPRTGGEPVKVESAQAISDLVPVGELLYFLRVTASETVLVRRNTDGSRSEIYTFAAGSESGALSAFRGNLYVLIDGQIHIIYPATGQCVKLADTQMEEYAVIGDYLYYISSNDIMTYETQSLLGADMLEGSAGCLYRMNLQSGASSLVIKTGIEDLRYYDGALYFHNLSDNYVMGDEAREWLEGKVYRFDLESEQLTRLTGSYDWGFYPMDGGVAVYTSGTLSFYNNLGGLERTMYEPEAYAVLSGGGDAVVVYEPTGTVVTYVLADGTAREAGEGDPNYVEPTALPFETATEPLADPASAGGEGEDGDLAGADSQWYQTSAPGAADSDGGASAGGASTGSGGSAGGTAVDWDDGVRYTEKDGG